MSILEFSNGITSRFPPNTNTDKGWDKFRVSLYGLGLCPLQQARGEWEGTLSLPGWLTRTKGPPGEAGLGGASGGSQC